MKKILLILLGIILFSILPLLGWGISDLNGFFGNPIRIAFTITMALLSTWVALFVPNEGRGEGKGKEFMKRHNISLAVTQAFSIAIVLGAPFSDHQSFLVLGENSILRLAGLFLAVSGFIFMNWSVIVLGRQFSTDITLQENHQLVTTGPYKYIRHPRYLGIILFFIGISLVFRSIISLLMIIPLITVLYWRISDEEKLMKNVFGEVWDQYKMRSYYLIPFIW